LHGHHLPNFNYFDNNSFNQKNIQKNKKERKRQKRAKLRIKSNFLQFLTKNIPIGCFLF
jgi:hypothetical protein